MPTTQNFAQYLRTLQTLFFALLGAQIFICGIFWFLQKDQTELILQETFWLQGIVVFTVIWISGSVFLRKKLIERARALETLLEKLNQYRTVSIISWATIEGATLLNAVFFFLSGKMEYLYIAGAVIALFTTQVPARNKIVTELDLDSEEQSRLDDPNGAVAHVPKGK